MHNEINGKTGSLGLSAPENLNDSHDLTKFECSEESINDYLRQAHKHAKAKNAVIYVCCEVGTNVVRAFYTLSNGSVVRNEAPKKAQRFSPSQIPIKGIGSDLLKDAVMRSMQASTLIGSRALIVHALHEHATRFYTKHGFIPSPISERTLFLLLK